MTVEKNPFEAEIQKYNEITGSPFPSWEEIRAILKEWGVSMLTRGVVILIQRIILEKKIGRADIEKTFKKLIIESLKYLESRKQRRLYSSHVLHVLKTKFPSISDLEMFRKEALQKEFERSRDGFYNNTLTDLEYIPFLSIVEEFLPEEYEFFQDLWIDSLPIPENINKFIELKLQHNILEVDGKSNEDLYNEIINLETVIIEYNEVGWNLKERGTEAQSKRFQEKLNKLIELLGEDFDAKKHFTFEQDDDF
jgi:hypothetical protein